MSLLLVASIALALLLAGILLGRYYVPDTRPLRRAAKQGAMYIRGLNHVLTQDHDAAIAELSKAVRESTAAPETYFALGVLFRERGEVERAVRVHQSLLVRGDVDRRVRLEALFQLGLDFEAAGFGRRARRAYEQVLDKDPKFIPALRKLLARHESEENWAAALKALRRIEKLEKRPAPEHEAHLLAEAARAAMEAGDIRAARKHLRAAEGLSPQSVHVAYVAGRVAGAQDRWDRAVETWLAALERAPDLAAFFVPLLEDAAYRQGRLAALLERLEAVLARHPENVHLRMAHARLLGKRDPALALPLIRGVVQQAPSLLPARRILGRLVLSSGDAEAAVREYEALIDALERVERAYRCARCGHTTQALFWKCPHCHAWDSVRVAWGRRAGEGVVGRAEDAPAIPGGARDRRQSPRRTS